MGLIQDDLGIEVEETVLQRVQDPKFTETAGVLDYWLKRRTKEREIKETEEKQSQEAAAEKSKMFGLF